MFLRIGALKTSVLVFRPATIVKIDFNTDVFL